MKKSIRISITVLLSILFCLIINNALSEYIVENTIKFADSFKYNIIVFDLVIGCLFGIIMYAIIINSLYKKMSASLISVFNRINNMSLDEIIINSLCIIIGLVIANLLGIPILKLGLVGTCVVICLNLVLGYVGLVIATKKRYRINLIDKKGDNKSLKSAQPKILDTSVIIDGRILDILKTGFVEGKILIPQFVLGELRHIADSSDNLKRNRGRRGLDILNHIQKQLKVPVEVTEKDYEDIPEVDSKLLKLAEEVEGAVLTNDYNLNKVANVKGVVVLNINELANAVKPVVLPGEDMRVTVIKDGKEQEQGIAYLNDGTMIVIEGGKKAIGQTIEVLVTSVLQTAAGRMIFTKVK